MGGKLSRAVYLAPNLSINSSTFYDHFTSFKLSEYEVESIAVIMQVKLSCIPCGLVSYAWLQRRGQAVQGGLSCPPPLHLSIDSSNFYDHFNYFKLSEYEVASIEVIMQVKLSCLPCGSVSYAWLQRRGASCTGRFILLPT